jgi:hypothetical protein
MAHDQLPAGFTRVCVRAARVFTLLCWPALLPAQARLPELSSLKPSDAPAFVLLGASPTAVERPGSPPDLALMLVNRTGGFTSLPSDFATEIAPYWLRARPSLTWQSDTSRTVEQSFSRTFMVSAASAEIGNEDAPRTGIAIGGRFLLLSGRLSAASQDSLRALERSLRAESGIMNRLLQPRRQALDNDMTRQLSSLDTVRDERVRRLAQSMISGQFEAAKRALIAQVEADPAFQDSIACVRERFENIALERVGPILEIAGAFGWGFPDHVFQRGHFDRWAVWGVFGWARSTALDDGAKLMPLAVLRYVSNAADASANYLDAGGRVILNDDRYGASLELVARQPMGVSGARTQYRLAGVLEYQLREDIWAIAGFGRDHESANEGNLIAQLGVRVQFIDERFQKR